MDVSNVGETSGTIEEAEAPSSGEGGTVQEKGEKRYVRSLSPLSFVVVVGWGRVGGMEEHILICVCGYNCIIFTLGTWIRRDSIYG